MRSNNPVFNRSEEFNRAGGAQYATFEQGYQPYGGPQGQQSMPPTHTPVDAGRMTVDTVVQKTAVSLGVVIIAAFVTWVVTPDLNVSTVNYGPLFAALTIGSLGAFALSMVNSFKRQISPALVLLFCAFEGVAMGAFSKVIDAAVAEQAGDHGVVIQAVVGTFGAFAGTLAVYKFFNIKVGAKFQRFVIAAMFGMIGLSLMELVLGLFGNSLGLFGLTPLGAITAVAGLALGVFMLILDFDFVEQGVRNGIPERESWRAAFALTVSLVWIYTNLLRLLAILSDN